jgi:hypothetical protein
MTSLLVLEMFQAETEGKIIASIYDLKPKEIGLKSCG